MGSMKQVFTLIALMVLSLLLLTIGKALAEETVRLAEKIMGTPE